jgi:hypothetical protein
LRWAPSGRVNFWNSGTNDYQQRDDHVIRYFLREELATFDTSR